MSPMIVNSLISDRHEVLKYITLGILIISIFFLLYKHERKKKRVEQDKGKWIIVKALRIFVK